jgi:hypothetical protein
MTVFEAHRTGRRKAYTYLKDFVLERLEVSDWPLDAMPKLPRLVETVAPDTAIQEAASRMRSLDVGILPFPKEIALSEC